MNLLNLSKLSLDEMLSGSFGIEWESLRARGDGELALTPHPELFGDKLKNPLVTTDFSESQIEIITPTFNTIDETFDATAVYGADYTYKGFVVVDTGNSFDWVGSYTAATPLSTAKMHALIECPELVAESTEPLSVIITLSNGVEYTCVIR